MVVQLPGSAGGRWLKTGTQSYSSTIVTVSGWTAQRTPIGISESSGTFTLSKAGKWLFVVNMQGGNGNIDGWIVLGVTDDSVILAGNNSAATSDGSRNGFPMSEVFLAGQQIRLRCRSTTSHTSTASAFGFNISALWIGP